MDMSFVAHGFLEFNFPNVSPIFKPYCLKKSNIDRVSPQVFGAIESLYSFETKKDLSYKSVLFILFEGKYLIQ